MNSEMNVFVFAIMCAATFRLSDATLGVDVSTAVDTESWKCLKKDGYSFAIVRIYRSDGKVDVNAAKTIKNAHEAGIKYVDGYIFPCKKCGDPKGQVRAALANLKKHKAKIGQVWLDVEGEKYWSRNKTENVQFIKDMVNEVKAQKRVVAIYTSAVQWKPITGNAKGFQHLQLWYANYDNENNFSDFKPFGGWKKPAMKQFKGTTKVCDVGVDKNWYP